MRLFAKWLPGQDSNDENPAVIVWEDGRKATLRDYAEHYAAHQTLIVSRKKGDILVLYTDEMSDVSFNHSLSRWVYTTPNKIEIILNLSDPEADDAEINKAIATQAVFIADQRFRRQKTRKRQSNGASG